MTLLELIAQHPFYTVLFTFIVLAGIQWIIGEILCAYKTKIRLEQACRHKWVKHSEIEKTSCRTECEGIYKYYTHTNYYIMQCEYCGEFDEVKMGVRTSGP